MEDEAVYSASNNDNELAMPNNLDDSLHSFSANNDKTQGRNLNA